MFLKNYTSDVPVSRTLARIEEVLIRCGVLGIAKEYAGVNGKIAALTFAIKVDDATPTVTIRLPVDEEKALQALWTDYAGDDELSRDGKSVLSSYKKKRRESFREQAERTAWRIMQDWVEVQMSMISMKQADFLQVFLPYIWDGKRTYYESLRQSRFAGLLPERAGVDS